MINVFPDISRCQFDTEVKIYFVIVICTTHFLELFFFQYWKNSDSSLSKILWLTCISALLSLFTRVTNVLQVSLPIPPVSPFKVILCLEKVLIVSTNSYFFSSFLYYIWLWQYYLEISCDIWMSNISNSIYLVSSVVFFDPDPIEYLITKGTSFATDYLTTFFFSYYEYRLLDAIFQFERLTFRKIDIFVHCLDYDVVQTKKYWNVSYWAIQSWIDNCTHS